MPSATPPNLSDQIAQLIRDVAKLRRQVRIPEAWVPLTLNAGFTGTGSTSYDVAIRCQGEMVELCGHVAGTIAVGGTAILTLPAAYWPAKNINAACVGNSGNFCHASISSTTGVLTAFPTVAASGMSLDSIKYRLV